jgi:hypothetical protein
MFGYTVPLYSRLPASDMRAYRQYYCEGCHQLKRGYGLVSTAAVNYDMTFNTIVLNSVSENGSPSPEGAKGRICVLRRCACDTELMKRMAGYTVLLTKWELYDDKVDKPSLKSDMISLMLGRAISKAEAEYPEDDRAVGNGFDDLRRLESQGCTDARLLGRTFGSSLTGALKDATDAWNGDLDEMFVSLSTLVYVLDAVDDLEEDYRNGTYNPFLQDCERFINKEDYIAKNIYSLSEVINGISGELQSAYVKVRPMMVRNTGIADNVIYHGLPDSAKRVLTGQSEAKMSLKNALSRRSLRTADI